MPENEAPEPSQQEIDAWDTILSELEQQNDYNEAMLPSQMHDAHMGWKWNTEDGLPPVGKDPDYTEEQQIVMKEKKRLEKMVENGGLDYVFAKPELDKINAQIASWGTLPTKPPKPGDLDYGSWQQLSDDEWYNDSMTTDSEREIWDLDKAQRKRSKDALEGNLPLNESLLSQKEKEFADLKTIYGITGDTLENATGEDTVAIQNLDAFKKRWIQIEDAQRYGQSSSSIEGSILSRGLTSDLTTNQTGTTAALGGNNSSTIPGYLSLLNPMSNYNMAGYQAKAANNANTSAMMGSGLGLLAMLAMAASSKDYKKDIKGKSKKDEDDALKKLKNTKSYDYRYKSMMNMGNRKHLGTIAEESPKEITAMNGKAIDLNSKMEFMSMALKSLDRKVEKIAKSR